MQCIFWSGYSANSSEALELCLMLERDNYLILPGYTGAGVEYCIWVCVKF